MSMSPDTLPKVTPSFLGKTLNNFQAWALEKPDNLLSKIFLPPISFIEGMLGNNPVYLDGKRQALGLNFCCAGEVVLGEFPTLETTLTSPQARTWRLGTTMLSKDHDQLLEEDGLYASLYNLQMLEA